MFESDDGRWLTEQVGAPVLDHGRATDVIDSSLLTTGADRSILGPTDLMPAGRRPHPLATTPVGSDLTALIENCDVGTLPDAALVDLVAASERLKGWADAVAVAGTAELVARCQRLRGVGSGVLEVPAEQVAAAELAAGLGVSPRTARNRVEVACAVERLPATRDLLRSGQIGMPAARAVVEATAVLDAETAMEVDARVAPRAVGTSLPSFRAALLRAVLAADPAAGEARRDAAVKARDVWTEAMDDGMGRLVWDAPAEQIQSTYTWVNELARRARDGDRAAARRARDGGQPVPPVRGLAECRSDVLGDLPGWAAAVGAHDAPPASTAVPQIGVVVAASTLLGLDDEPGELAGHGPIPASVAREIASSGTWRRLLTDPAGRLLDVSVRTYEPPESMRRAVSIRDRTCFGPGCRLPADRCDDDHTVPWPTGPTSAGNLHPLCRSHHRLKTLTDTAVADDSAGGLVWTMPSGRRWRRAAEPVLAMSASAMPGTDPGRPPPQAPPETRPDPPPF